RLAARELGLTLTSRNNGGAAEVPLAGVPVKAGTEYLRRLIAKGHRVAICEQVEDPKLAKGLVRREVVETITPGTVLAEDWLERKPGGLPNLARPRVVRRGAVLPLDDMTRRNLELVESLRPDGGVTGTTVLEVLDRTMTSMGARLLRRWLLAPLVDPGAINARLDAVEVLVRDP